MTTEDPLFLLFLLALLLVALLYSSVGHGGASGYLALMAIFSFSPESIRPTALLLNLFVAGIAFFHYFRAGYFRGNLFLSFALSSVPLAFLGGMFTIDGGVYKKLLGLLLVFAVVKIVYDFPREEKEIRKVKFWKAALCGSAIGFVSGLIGIGGGIILTPLILFFHWGNMKIAAAVSALFIVVNSAAGLLGQLSLGVELLEESFLLVGIALTGGFIGSYFGSKKWKSMLLRYILAGVLLIASLKLFFV